MRDTHDILKVKAFTFFIGSNRYQSNIQSRVKCRDSFCHETDLSLTVAFSDGHFSLGKPCRYCMGSCIVVSTLMLSLNKALLRCFPLFWCVIVFV